jgi:hypothetical protein
VNVRALFWEEAYAALVASRLRSDGFTVETARERFAGEDDDEDVAWAVSTDAPPMMVEMLAEEYDGWLDETPVEPPSTPASGLPRPLDLPDGPRRTKGREGES